MGVGLRGRWRIDVRRKPMREIAATRMLCCARRRQRSCLGHTSRRETSAATRPVPVESESSSIREADEDLIPASEKEGRGNTKRPPEGAGEMGRVAEAGGVRRFGQRTALQR